jgi:hypothetical protein
MVDAESKLQAMNDSAPPKNRRCWQIHLSTALLCMLLAGWFLYMNVGKPEVTRGKCTGPIDLSTGRLAEGREPLYEFHVAYRSWPLVNQWNSSGHHTAAEAVERLNASGAEYDCLQQNLALGVAALVIIAFASEYLIRRRAAPDISDPAKHSIQAPP